jgi:hypothetical protein
MQPTPALQFYGYIPLSQRIANSCVFLPVGLTREKFSVHGFIVL